MSRLSEILTKAKALKITGDKRDHLCYLTTLKQDEAAIKAYIAEVIGEDEPTNPYSPEGHDKNRLRAEQRKRAGLEGAK